MKNSLIILLGMGLLAKTPVGADQKCGDFVYESHDSAVTITKYTGAGDVAVIPPTINDLQVTSIGRAAFAFCTNLSSVAIPKGVTHIGDEAFWGCTRLSSVTIPSSVANIGVCAFYLCGSLTNVAIPNGVSILGKNAFGFCTNLTNATIPASVTNFSYNPFVGCSRVAAITVDAGNPAYSSVAGVLFSKDKTTLLECPGGKAGTYAIPNSVTSIFWEAFSYCHELVSITIPGSVTSIGCQAFSGCTGLTNVFFQGNCPSFYENLSDDLFLGCSNNPTVYYLPNKTGWGTHVAGRPTVVWTTNSSNRTHRASDAPRLILPN